MTKLNEEVAYSGPWRPAKAPQVDPLWEPGRNDEPISLADELFEAGVPDAILPSVEQILKRRIASERFEAGSHAVSALLGRLGDTPAAWSVRLAVYGTDADKTLSKAALSSGITKQSMAERVGRVKKRLGL